MGPHRKLDGAMWHNAKRALKVMSFRIGFRASPMVITLDSWMKNIFHMFLGLKRRPYQVWREDSLLCPKEAHVICGIQKFPIQMYWNITLSASQPVFEEKCVAFLGHFFEIWKQKSQGSLSLWQILFSTDARRNKWLSLQDPTRDYEVVGRRLKELLKDMGQEERKEYWKYIHNSASGNGLNCSVTRCISGILNWRYWICWA